MTVRDWDARTYDRLADPHERWALPVIERLGLRGDEVVLDAGCGSGRITRLLLERLPAGRVYGVDRSPAMLAVAREQLAGWGERVCLIEGDLTAVRLPEPVDAIFSNATFHWVFDHVALFTNLAALLRPGGTLSAQCGGGANIRRIVAAAERALAIEPFAGAHPPVRQSYHFAGPAETSARLTAAGFEDVRSWLEEQPVTLPDAAAFAAYLKTVVVGPYLAVLPERLHDALVEAVVAEDERAGGTLTVDYVRLNMTGRREADPRSGEAARRTAP